MTIRIAAIVGLHLLLVAKPLHAVQAPTPKPAPTVTIPPVVITACVSRPLVQGSGNVRVCAGGQL